MRYSTANRFSLLAPALFASSALAQTFTTCNPLTQTCPPDKALGGSANIDFTQGQSNDFTADSSTVSYGSSGLQLTIGQEGNAPTLTSNWYIMFGRVDVTLKSSPGTGIVTSSVLQSDDLDEIDWEFLGSQGSVVQTNYFGKGQTGSYDRSTTVAAPNSQTQFNTYSIDWNSNTLEWSINGQTVRTLTATQAGSQYPQTPMRLKIGTWAGGDSDNSPGTVAWAGGSTDFSAGPFSAYVQSVKVQDYSTGTQYTYSGTSGTWSSITAVGGTVNGNAGQKGLDQASSAVSGQSTSGIPAPFSQSTTVTATGYPWVAATTGTPTTSSLHAGTSTPGVGTWTLTGSANTEPLSSAATSTLASSSQAWSTSYVGGYAPVGTGLSGSAGSTGMGGGYGGNSTRPTAPTSAPTSAYTGAASVMKPLNGALAAVGVLGLAALL